MAIASTIHNFTIELSHADRGVYESVELRVERHPSESAEFLCARVLAFCLEHREGLAFSKGLSDPDRPALEVRDLTGTLQAWIEIGAPDAERLHRASKGTPRVVVYTHYDPARYWRSLEGARIHRAESVEFYALDPELLDALVTRLDRRMAFELSVTGDVMYLTLGDESFSGPVGANRLTG